MATDAELEVLRHSVDLVSYISQHVQLTKRGNEYRGLCIFHDDHTPSLNVVPSRQIWNCFSCNEHLVHGSDVFGFVRSLYGCTFPEAVLKLQNGNGAGEAKPIIRPPLKKRPPRELLVPPEGSMPDMERGDMGKPLKYWTITTLDGKPWMYECRYVALSGPSKETRPFSYGRYSSSDPPRWECRWPEKDRPFYGLDQLGSRLGDQVMIHEAAKKADAGRLLLPNLVHLGLLMGSAGSSYIDVKPLAGRRCILMPDNDDKSLKSMAKLAERLFEVGAYSTTGKDAFKVFWINPAFQPHPDNPELAGEPSPPAWDLADVTDWTPAIALAWAKARKTEYKSNAAPQQVSLAPPQVLAGERAQAAGAAPETLAKGGANADASTVAGTDAVTGDAHPNNASNAAPEPGPVNPSVAPATPEPAQEAAPDSPERAQAHPKGNGGAGPPLTPAERAQAQETLARSEVLSSMVYRKASSVRMRATDWLWPGKIPLGEICVIQGDPGLGKSQITASLCAIITRGGQWPLTREPCDVGSVIVLSAEDSTAKTIVPRLAAAGADLDRVTILQSIKHEYGTRGFSLLADMLALDTLLGEEDNPMAVIVDPISAYQDPVGAGAKQHDSHKNTDVRSLLRPVSELVDRRNVTMILINHLTKGAGRAITRGQGNMAFVAGPRAVWQVSKDKDDPRKRLFLPVKNNLADDSGETGLSFSVEPVDLGMDDQGKPIRTSRILWNDERVTITADEAAGYDSLSQDERGSVSDAQEFLKEALAECRLKAKDVERQAKDAGHNMTTLGRAKRALGIISEKEGFGAATVWYWRLKREEAPAEIRSWVKDD